MTTFEAMNGWRIKTVDPTQLGAFVADVMAGRIPAAASLDRDTFPSVETFQARDVCTSRGMWAIIDQQWTKQLARWIKQRRCLEIMAGAGWLARALHEQGVQIRATDDYSWDHGPHTQMQRVFGVERCDAVAAVEQAHDADVLIVSWPPYEDDTITRVCAAWGPLRPIVYVGEGEGGCNAPDSFWAGFEEDPVSPTIPLPTWPGLHDRVTIGYWCDVTGTGGFDGHG